MSIVALIPARGGSKGIPGKNLISLEGKPLIAYTIDAARCAPSIDRILVTTDDLKIAETCKKNGIEVPFMRPAELADDLTPMLAVVQHALDWLLKKGESIEAIVLLQPTSPLRMSSHIEEALALFRATSPDSVVSVVEVPHNFNPVSALKLTHKGLLVPFVGDYAKATRRQDKPMAYARNGPAVLVCNPRTILSGELYGAICVPYLMSEEDSLDIDLPKDLDVASQLLRARQKKLNDKPS